MLSRHGLNADGDLVPPNVTFYSSTRICYEWINQRSGSGYRIRLPLSLYNRDIGTHIERVLGVTFLQPIMYRPKLGIVKARKLSVRSKIFLFSKTVQDNENRSAADICLVMQAVGQARHSLSM